MAGETNLIQNEYNRVFFEKRKMELYVFYDIEEEIKYPARHCDHKATSKGLFDECNYIGNPNTLEGNLTTKHSQMNNN